MKKYIYLTTGFLLLNFQSLLACDLCKKNQPKGLENITHGMGPTSPMDYIISWTSVIIVLFTLALSIKYLIKPKESDPKHIKNIVLNPDR